MAPYFPYGINRVTLSSSQIAIGDADLEDLRKQEAHTLGKSFVMEWIIAREKRDNWQRVSRLTSGMYTGGRNSKKDRSYAGYVVKDTTEKKAREI